jgi:hypothetical protein
MPRKGGSVSIIQQKNEQIIQHSTSDRVSICANCGKPFAQVWREEYQAYTSFKTCGSCRMKNASGGINVSVDYTPHWGQQLVHNSNAKVKIVNAGNRWGKDRCFNMEGQDYFIQCLSEEWRASDNSLIPKVLWWIIAPVEKIANQNWRELLATFPKELVTGVSETTRTVTTVNGGIIEVHSAYDPEALVSVGLDLVTITEAARIADMEDVWDNVSARLISPGRGYGGKGGLALINSSPLGMNYFYKMWKWGQKGTSEWMPGFESWTFTTWDNPYMAVKGDEIESNGKTYKENLQRRMSKSKYRQNFLAEFLADICSVFPNYDRVLVKDPVDSTLEQINKFWQEWEKPDPYEEYTLGYDPASKGDGHPVVIRNSKGRIVKIDQMISLGRNYEAQWDRIAFYSRMYNNAHCNFGQTGVGETIGSQLTKRGVTNTPIPEQGRNKERLVDDFSIVVEQQWCEIPWSQEVENQFKGYIAVNRSGHSTQYHNNDDVEFDDIISALYFCFSGFESVIESAGVGCGYMAGVNKAS